MTARAEVSSEKVYPLALPGVHSEPATPSKSDERTKTHPGHQGNPDADTPGPPGKGVEPEAGRADEPDGDTEPAQRHRHADAAAGEAGGRPPGDGGRPGEGSSSPKESVSPEAAEITPDKADTADAGGGGSSPALPILIAMAVLAAASIGIVLYRDRRRDGRTEP